MTLVRPQDHAAVRALTALLDCNPFVPERLVLERQALGSAFVPMPEVWHAGDSAGAALNPNIPRLHELAERLGAERHRRLAAGAKVSEAAPVEYRELMLIPGAAAESATLSAGGPDRDGSEPDAFLAGVLDGSLTADEVVQGYCARVHAQSGNNTLASARRLKLNWKTVHRKVQAWRRRTNAGAE